MRARQEAVIFIEKAYPPRIVPEGEDSPVVFRLKALAETRWTYAEWGVNERYLRSLLKLAQLLCYSAVVAFYVNETRKTLQG
jgi:hypothetical protein